MACFIEQHVACHLAIILTCIIADGYRFPQGRSKDSDVRKRDRVFESEQRSPRVRREKASCRSGPHPDPRIPDWRQQSDGSKCRKTWFRAHPRAKPRGGTGECIFLVGCGVALMRGDLQD